jgi:Flp pilus assembly protein TadG
MARRSLMFRRKSRLTNEAGQTTVFFVLVLGIFLLGALCLAFDLSNMWFHRQAAQSAADAACTAGAMDLLVDAQGGATGHQGFTPGTDYTCTTTSTDSVCSYANKNGYSSTNASPGDLVSVSFPATVAGVTPPPTGMTTTPFIRVDILDHVQTFFFGLLSGRTTADVATHATCGVEEAASPIPIVVLDPQSPQSTPAQSALNIQGNGTIAIVGGPSKSIQVNSGANAGTCGQSNCSINLPWGSAQVDLHLAGPNGTGADIGLWGAPPTGSSQIPGGFLPGSTGHWIAPAAPIPDPFAQVCAPGQTGCPSLNGNAPPAVPGPPPVPLDISTIPGCTAPTDIQAGNCTVPAGIHGCPDTTCVFYNYGIYPSQIHVKNKTAIFDPGLYYVTGGLNLDSNSTVRPGTGDGDGSGGVTFYFAGSGSTAGTVTVASNSGTKTGLVPFNTRSGSGSYPNGIKCTSGSTIPGNVPATLGGNILLGPCTGYYGDPQGASDPLGVQRGFLFFQDRSGQSIDPGWGGGGQFLLAGTMYFHSCNSSGTGVGCGAAPTYYNDIFTLQGNSGSGTYVLGSIVTDNLTLEGTSGITMDLNPTKYFSILKATLLQ